MVTVALGLVDASAQLPGDCARLEAETLLAHTLGRTRAWLYAHGDDLLDDDARRRFHSLVQLRQQGQPLAYLVGRREFWSLDLAVAADTLIPRPETELLVELALRQLPDDAGCRILDLGTGSGAIALAIAGERLRARVVAIDASPQALAMAEKNAARCGIEGVEFLRSNWYSALDGERFNLIVSNPPYIADNDPHLEQGDLRFEPRMALASGADGLDAIRIIVAQAAEHLRTDGWLLVEHGWQQGAAVRTLFAAAGFSGVETSPDLENRERVTCGKGLGPDAFP